MNLISVYVAVGAIAFVRCQASYNFVSPPEIRHFNQLLKDESKETENNSRKSTMGTADVSEDSRKKNKLLWGGNVEVKEGERKEVAESETEFSEGFRQMKRIYEECKARVHKRLKKLVRIKVNSGVNKNLFEMKEFFSSIYKCLKVSTFRSLDRVLEGDYVPLTDYAYFVKDGVNVTEDFPPGVRGGGNPLRALEKDAPVGIREYATSVLDKEWSALVFDRLEGLLRSHSLKFHLNQSLIPKGRSRRRDHRMFAMMVMGFMIMASILIPMGFQFLTVLGGKSLLMAKMALIISAISGLKKIATSNVGYGLYHTGSDGHHHDHLHHGFHEKHFHLNSPNAPTQYGFSK